MWDGPEQVRRVYSKRVHDINDLKDRIQTVISAISHKINVQALNATVAH